MTKISARIIIAVMGTLLCGGAALADEEFGHFQGDLVFQAIGAEGRDMKVLAPFVYIDPAQRKWTVPSGTIVNGASIPSAFWSVIGAPYTGQYRDASVIHDHYCETKTREWKDVHLAFYNGTRAKGVGFMKAQMMYAAVYTFGPRWIVAADAAGKETTIAGRPRFDETAKAKLIAYASEGQRSIGEIDNFADRVLRVADADEAEEHIRQQPDCGPVISSTEGANNVYMLCGLDRNAKKLNAGRNLDILVRDLRRLYAANTFFLVPALELYRREPTETHWQEAKDEMLKTRNLVKIAILSALDYDASLVDSLGTTTSRLYGVLQSRLVMLDELAEGPPADPAALDVWIPRYRNLIMQLGEELAKLQSDLMAQRKP